MSKKYVWLALIPLLSACGFNYTGANRVPDESRSVVLPPLRSVNVDAPLPLPQEKKSAESAQEIANQTRALLGQKPVDTARLSESEKALLDKAGTNLDAAKKAPPAEPAPSRTLLEEWLGVTARR